MNKIPNIATDWWAELQQEFNQPYMQTLRDFLKQELQTHTVYPPMKDVFNAFLYTPLTQVRVVILGQDPYHGPDQAHGLCFSVRQGINPPPSLVNIFKEIKKDIQSSSTPQELRPELQNWNGSAHDISGQLTSWAEQGVFLLNTVLTVRKSSPGSHRSKGWEKLTDYVIAKVSQVKSKVVFILWGSFAHQKEILIDSHKHLILKSPHPSPFSADRGFFGCKHFSKTNHYLRNNGLPPIIW